jgi:hypothetical protein
MKSESGLVVSYSFLWSREAEAGEESGRKSRPVCLQLLMNPTQARPDPVLLLPITSQPPEPDALAVAIPELECRRLALRAPAWIVLEEVNLDIDFRRSPFIDNPNPIGSFSATFTREVRRRLRDALVARRLRLTARPHG